MLGMGHVPGICASRAIRPISAGVFVSRFKVRPTTVDVDFRPIYLVSQQTNRNVAPHDMCFSLLILSARSFHSESPEVARTLKRL